MSIVIKSILSSALLLIALPALGQENCAVPDVDRQFQRIEFSDASVVDVLSRNDNKLT